MDTGIDSMTKETKPEYHQHRVVCQCCGKTGIIDLQKPLNEQTVGWDWFSLTDFFPEMEAWDIWICPECVPHKFNSLVINWDALTEKIKDVKP